MLIRLILIISLLLSSCQNRKINSIPFTLQIHPDGKLYIGDIISFEIIPESSWESEGKQVQVSLDGHELGVQNFEKSGIGQRWQATFRWILDSSDFKAGDYGLTFKILPDGLTWNESIHLDPENKNPDLQAEWVTVYSLCCLLRYISGTDAARDIEVLSEMVDDQVDEVESRLNTNLSKKIEITLIPRLIGQGGFTANGIYVTYSDENITGNISTQVIHHEIVHVLDSSMGNGLKPAMFVEGLAVYLSGGHYKQEDLLNRAASLFELDSYIPFELLLKDFYSQQHEISYLEAGSLVGFMVDKYGWDSFKEFYSGIDLNGGEGESLEENLEKEFDIDIALLEQDFIQQLNSQKVEELTTNDLKLTIELFDSIRSYQQNLDPSAYFATAWLPDGAAMQEKGIVADYLRTRSGLDIFFIESLLRNASQELYMGNFTKADWILRLVNIILEFY